LILSSFLSLLLNSFLDRIGSSGRSAGPTDPTGANGANGTSGSTGSGGEGNNGGNGEKNGPKRVKTGSKMAQKRPKTGPICVTRDSERVKEGSKASNGSK